MKPKWILLLASCLASWSGGTPAQAQNFFVDCSCLSTQAVLVTNACQAVMPDLCQFTNCWRSTAVPPPPLTCSQNPPAGTPVGPGVWGVVLTILDPNGVAQSCALNFTVNPPSSGCGQPFSLLCASNKTVECGSAWTFDPPTWTNACVPPAGTVSNGVILTLVSTVTNGTCPQVITRTWQAVDDCKQSATCSQTVTVVDTTPPVLNCNCLTNPAVNPVLVPMTVIACTSSIPDLCLAARICATDNCGPLTCSQVPAAGTPVGPGSYPITVIVTDCAGNKAACTLTYTVVAPATGCGQPFSILCASNKTVECGSGWTFDPPTWTNACVPPAGTVSNGVILTLVSTVTNGTCPQVITRTWQATDDCGQSATCSQTVTVVDTTPPVLACDCLTNTAVNPMAVPLSVVACTSTIPNLCLSMQFCASDRCGPLTCVQSPAAGTPVGPGTHPITVTIRDCASNAAVCLLKYTVVAPTGGCITNPCLPPPAGMVAWWPLDETTGATLFTDATGNGNTAVVESGGPVGSGGSPSAVVGKVAGANYFYGLSPRGRALNAPLLNFGQGSFSVDAWVKPVLTGPIHWHPIVDKLNQTSPTTGFGYAVGLLNSNLVLKVGSGTLYTYTSVGTVSFAAWNFVAVSVDRTAGTVTFRVNGVTESPQVLTPAGSFNSGVDLLIGSTWNTGLPLGELAVDELELFSRPLATSELAALWSADSLGKCKTNSCLISIFCPTNQVVTVPCTQNCAVVTYTPPLVANGTLAGCSPPSGTCLQVGVTTITCVATNRCGQPTSCQFLVTVNPATNCLPCDPTLAQKLYTGTTATGALLATGSPEPLWSNTAAPGGPIPLVVVDTNLWPIAGGPWLPPSPQSAWVGPSVSAVGPVGLYTNRWTFNAPCTNVCLRGRFVADDAAFLYLNGTLIAGPANYAPWVTVNVCTGFSNGLNTLELVITNAFGPTGFRTELEVWTQCCCPTQTNIWNTGMGGTSGNVALSPNTPDPNYVLVSSPPGGCAGPAQVLLPSSLPVPPWLANGPNSQWIGGGPTASCQGGVYHYRLCFNLLCTDGAAIIGQWTADDWAGLYLNGQPTGHNVPSTQNPNLSFGGWHPVKLTNGFICGQNCLDFYVTNAWTFPNPTGLRAQLTNVFNNCCCEPAQTVFSVSSGQGQGGLLPVGSPDTQFALSCAPQGVSISTPVVVQPNGYWLPNSTTSQWIGPDPSNIGPGGLYCYTLSFYLPPCAKGNPSYSVKGRWMGDDAGTIFLNGLPTGQSLPIGWAFTNWSPINITSGLAAGLNTLTFYVTNASYGSTGVRIELAGYASCCDCAPVPCSCNFTNGGFDLPVPSNGSGNGWTSSGLFAGSGWQASGGNPGGTFLLNNVGAPNTDPTVSQRVCCLIPGHCYTIRGQRKVQAWYGQTAPSFAVLLDGAPILVLPVPTIPADTNWYDFAVSFTATKPCQTIGFAAEIKGTDVSYWIDNIRLECCNPNCQVSIKCPPDQVYLTCSNSAVATYVVGASGQNGPIICLPPSGSAFPMGVTWVSCTATNNCGAVANCSFKITVKPRPHKWDCYHLGVGIPFHPIGGATVAVRPEGELGDPAILVYPDASNPASGVLMQPGTPEAIRFTTMLDFTAPVGAGVDLVLPPGPGNVMGTPLLSMRNKGPKGYCVKVAKRFADDPSGAFRAMVVNSDGQLLDSLSFSSAEIQATGVFDIVGQPGISDCHVTVELNCLDGSVSLEFSGPVMLSTERKGWDGLIYGPDRPVKKPTSRVVITPPATPGETPITDLYLYASGLEEVVIEEPTLTARGRRWGDGHVTLMKAYEDGRSMEFTPLADGGGVQVDLGHSESFSLRLTKFETNVLPGEQLLTRAIGPIRGLTNRPPPPFLDALLLQASADGVDCSADFSNLDSPTVRVLVYHDGLLVADRPGVSAALDTRLLTLPEWPAGLGKLGGRTPCRVIKTRPGWIRLAGSGAGLAADGGGYPEEAVMGDEVRVLAEMADDAPRPDYYSGFEFIASEDADWGVSDLQRNLACPPVLLNVLQGPDGLILEWPGEDFRLLGAERVTGPWLDLGVSSPVVLPATHPARFFRLVCD